MFVSILSKQSIKALYQRTKNKEKSISLCYATPWLINRTAPGLEIAVSDPLKSAF